MLPPSGSPRAGDAVHRAAAALGADQARAPFRHRQIGTVTLGLLAGIDIDPVPAGVAPGLSQTFPDQYASRVRRRHDLTSGYGLGFQTAEFLSTVVPKQVRQS